MTQRLLDLLKKIPLWLVQATGVQLQQRLDPNLRAMLFGGCILSVGFLLYRGLISGETAALLWANVVTLFNLDIVKKHPDEKSSISIQQVPTVIRLPAVEAMNAANETKSVLQDRVSVNLPVTPAVPATLPLGDEFDAAKERP